MKVYKIKNNEDLFSTGSTRVKFNKTGKIWKSFGDVSKHIHLFDSASYNIPFPYDGCHIIEYEMIVTADYQIVNDYPPEYYMKKIKPLFQLSIDQNMKLKTF